MSLLVYKAMCMTPTSYRCSVLFEMAQANVKLRGFRLRSMVIALKSTRSTVTWLQVHRLLAANLDCPVCLVACRWEMIAIQSILTIINARYYFLIFYVMLSSSCFLYMHNPNINL